MKDTLKEEEPLNKINDNTLYTNNFQRGQPLYKGPRAGSQVCPLFRGSIDRHPFFDLDYQVITLSN